MSFLKKVMSFSPVTAPFSGVIDDFSGAKQQADANQMAMTSWRLANDYNHPIQQMERLKAAGLNPNLVYGSGSVTGNTTGAPSLVGGGISTQSESAFKALGSILGAAQGKAQLNATNAAAQASSAAAGASGAQAANLGAQTAQTEIKNKFLERSMIADIDYKEALADKTRAEADISQGEADIFGAVGGAKGVGAAAGGLDTMKNIGKFFRGLIK